MTPEQQARANIDEMLARAGWAVQDADALNLYADQGVAVREFPLKTGHGHADYLLYVDRRAAGVVEAKPEGFTLRGVEAPVGEVQHRTAGKPACVPAASALSLREYGSRDPVHERVWTRSLAAAMSSAFILPIRWPKVSVRRELVQTPRGLTVCYFPNRKLATSLPTICARD